MTARRWLRVLARMVPAGRRDVWVREWEAEVVHRARMGRERGRGAFGHRVDAAWCAVGALEDALSLWRRGRRDGRVPRSLRLAGRSLARSPGFTVVAVLTLTLGIGATTAIFSVVEGVLLRPLPYGDPGELVDVQLSFARAAHGGGTIPASGPEFLELRAENDALSGMAGYWLGDVNLDGGGEPIRVSTASVSADFLPTLGVDATLGRGFVEGEDRPGRGGVVILSHGLWTRAFGADPEVVGAEVVVNGRPVQVVGVLPASFVFPGAQVELLRPATLDPALPGGRSSHYMSMLGRLAPGLAVEQAQERIDALAERWSVAFPDRHGIGPEHPIRLVPLRESLVGEARPMLLLLLGAVGVVLLIACANVATLMLVRGERRRHETGVRRALGGSRSDVAAPFVAESVVLAAAGGVLGTALAVAGSGLVERLGPTVLGRVGGVRVDGSVLLFAALSTLAATLLFGLAPAAATARDTVGALLRHTGRGGDARSAALRRSLVVGQVALAVTLVVASALLTRSLVTLRSSDPGFRAAGAVTLQLSLTSGSYPDLQEVVAFHGALARGLEELPGVEAAGAVRSLPFADAGGYETLSPLDRPVDPDNLWNASYQVVTRGWFRAMGVPLVQGGLPGADEAASGPGAVVVNQAMARAFWSGEDPLGRRFKLGPTDNANPELIVVGVVGDVRQRGYAGPVQPQFYVPLELAVDIYGGLGTRGMSLVVRSALPPAVALDQVRETIRGLDPGLPVSRAMPMEEILGRSVREERYLALMVGAFSLLALVLGGVGIGGVVSWTVTRRTRELGLRMALGAESGSLVRSVLLAAMALAGTGVGLGLVASWWATRLLADQLYQVDPRDPFAFAAAPALLLVVALVAAWIPARRATRIDPVRAIWAE